MSVNRTEKSNLAQPTPARPREAAPAVPAETKPGVAGDRTATARSAGEIATARDLVKAAILGAIARTGAKAPALDWSKLEWTPGQRLAVVPGPDGTEHTFVVRPKKDGFEAEPARAGAPAASVPAKPTGLSTERQAMLAAAKARIDAKASAIDATATQITGGNAIARGVNSLLNVFNKNMDEMQAARKNAVTLYKTELPADLARYEGMVKSAGKDPAKLAQADEYLKGAFAKADLAGKAFDKKAGELSQSNKFWAGTMADVAAGLATLGGVALCMTTFGLPIGAGLIAGAVAAGGAATVGAHALFDNQYDLGREGLSNLLVGGISAGATVFTAGLGGGALQFGRALIVREGVVGASTGLAASMASEGGQGFADGWQGRVMRSTLLGAGMGAATGGVAAKFGGRFLGTGLGGATRQAVTQTAFGAGVGAVGGGGAGFANEALDGFKEGWQGRVAQQSAGGAFSGAAYGLAPNLNARHQAVRGGQLAKRSAVPDSVSEVLHKKLQELELPVKSKADGDAIINRMLEDDAMGALMRQTLNDDKYGSGVREALAAYGPEVLKMDVKTPEGRAARLQLLTMAMQPETRRVLVEAAHQDMRTETAALKAHFKANPQDAMYDVVVLGAGPNGVNLANVANEAGTHSVLLAGDFSHFQREGAAFYTNSLAGVSKGSMTMKVGENMNVVHGGKVQASDMSATAYNQAGEVGDAIALGLHQAGRGKAADVLIDTYAVSASPIKNAKGERTHYAVTMSDGTVVNAKTLVTAGGLGKKPNLPADPLTRKVDTTTQQVADREIARTQSALDANDPAALREAKVLTTEQFLSAGNRMDDANALFRDQDVLVLGAGDGGITPAELALGLAPDAVYGQSTSQMGGAKSVTMVGEPHLFSRYAKLEVFKNNGQFAVVKDTYGVAMRDNPTTGKVEVLLQPMKKVPLLENGVPVLKGGKPATQTVPDGEPAWRSADKIVIACGTQSGIADVLKDVNPNPAKPLNFKDAGIAETIDVKTSDTPSGTLSVAQKIKGEDVYALGVGGGMDKRDGYSWLLDHGSRTVEFARQLFSEPAQVGLKAPLAITKAAPVEIDGGLLRRAIGGAADAPIARDPNYRAPGKRGDTAFRLKVKLDALLSKGFTMPDLDKLRLSVTQRGGELVLSSPDLAPASAKALAGAIAADPDFAYYLHDFTRIKAAKFEVEVAPGGKVVGHSLAIVN